MSCGYKSWPDYDTADHMIATGPTSPPTTNPISTPIEALFDAEERSAIAG